jgi:hypothetical protein
MRQLSKKIRFTRASGRGRRRIDAGTRPWFRPVQPGLRTKEGPGCIAEGTKLQDRLESEEGEA